MGAPTIPTIQNTGQLQLQLNAAFSTLWDAIEESGLTSDTLTQLETMNQTLQQQLVQNEAIKRALLLLLNEISVTNKGFSEQDLGATD